MTRDEFWNIIESARESGGDCDAVVAAVTRTLEGLSIEKVLGFDEEIHRLMDESYRMDLWAVAHIMKGGYCSDDGFHYFRQWLITKGRSYFEAALADPKLAADDVDSGAWCEGLSFAAASVYKARKGNYPE